MIYSHIIRHEICMSNFKSMDVYYQNYIILKIFCFSCCSILNPVNKSSKMNTLYI